MYPIYVPIQSYSTYLKTTLISLKSTYLQQIYNIQYVVISVIILLIEHIQHLTNDLKMPFRICLIHLSNSNNKQFV